MRRPYGMTLPFLPREWYDYLQTFRQEHSLTQWQTIILALTALQELAKRDPQALDGAVATVRERYKTSSGGTSGSGTT